MADQNPGNPVNPQPQLNSNSKFKKLFNLLFIISNK